MSFDFIKTRGREFPGGPVVRTGRFHCGGHGVNSWLGNQHPSSCTVWPNEQNPPNPRGIKTSHFGNVQKKTAEKPE